MCDLASSNADQSSPSLHAVFAFLFFFSPSVVFFFFFSLPFLSFFFHQNVAGLNHTCCCFYRELALLYPALAVWLHTGSVAFKSALPF